MQFMLLLIKQKLQHKIFKFLFSCVIGASHQLGIEFQQHLAFLDLLAIKNIHLGDNSSFEVLDHVD